MTTSVPFRVKNNSGQEVMITVWESWPLREGDFNVSCSDPIYKTLKPENSEQFQYNEDDERVCCIRIESIHPLGLVTSVNTFSLRSL